jgi:hypothetical protein
MMSSFMYIRERERVFLSVLKRYLRGGRERCNKYTIYYNINVHNYMNEYMNEYIINKV